MIKTILSILVCPIRFIMRPILNWVKNRSNKQTAAHSHMGTHEGSFTAIVLSDAPQKGLLVRSSVVGGQVFLGEAHKIPCGVLAHPVQKGDTACVQLLGCASSTMVVYSSDYIQAGAEVFTADAGQVQHKPKKPGTYYRIGLALHSARPGELVEIDPYNPTIFTVQDTPAAA